MTTRTATTGEQRVTLQGLTWQQYQKILDALPQTRAAHLIFDRGTPEIIIFLEEHESASELIGLCPFWLWKQDCSLDHCAQRLCGDRI